MIRKTLSTKKNEQNESRIIFVVQHSRKLRFRYKSNIFIKSSDWDEKTEYPKQKIARLKPIRSRVDNVESILNKICSDFSDEPDYLKEKGMIELLVRVYSKISDAERTKATIKDMVRREIVKENAGGKPIDDLSVLMGMYISDKGLRVQNMVLLHSIERYRFHNHKFNIYSMSADDVFSFLDFLRKEHKLATNANGELLDSYRRILDLTNSTNQAIKERGDNTIARIFKQLNTFFNWLVRKKLILHNPINDIDRKDRPKQNYDRGVISLTIEERNAISRYDFSEFPSLGVQRDIFIFQCLVGCRVSDLQSFRQSHILNDNGRPQLVYEPIKTSRERHIAVSVPLTKTAVQILKKYAVDDPNAPLFARKDENGKVINLQLSQPKYNDNIKKILTKVGINRLVVVVNPLTMKSEMKPISEVGSSHLARRTFVQLLYNKVSDPNIIGSMSGHKDGSKAFSRYRTVGDEIKENTIRFLED